MGCHLIILACNTASAKALRNIQQMDLPQIDPDKRVLGVIRPSVEAVVNYTKTNKVGVLGTVGTVQSLSYPIELKKQSDALEVFQEACPMWVPLVENGEGERMKVQIILLKKNVHQLMNQNKDIDTVILGCTHYPLLQAKIEQYLPKHVSVISQGDIVASSLKDYLKRHPEMDMRCSKEGTVQFYTTENIEKFEQTAGYFLKEEINVKNLHL